MKHLLSILTIIFLFFGCSKGDDSSVNIPNQTKKYNVTITLNPSNGGSVSPNGGQFDENKIVSFTVTPSQNYLFKNWSGADTSSDNPLLLLVNSNKTLTVNFEKKDTDEDGVTNDIDQCPDTPNGEQVNETGCSSAQLDTDGDGVEDSVDQDNSTRSGVPVDDNGVMLNPIYLDENGITIKSEEWGIVGDTGIINGEEYLIVGNNTLRSGQETSKVCTSLVTNMREIFRESDFNGDISNWDVSSVTTMETMFAGTQFNGDIYSWEVSSVNRMYSMFEFNQIFNQNISSWDVSNVTNMQTMFKNTTKFNQDLSPWNVDNVVECRFFSKIFPEYGESVWTLPKPNFTNCDPY